MRWIAAALSLSLAATANAFLVNPLDEYATLTRDSEASQGAHHCLAPRGSTVKILGTPTDPGNPAMRGLLAVRVVTGSCSGLHLVISETLLSDFREGIEASTATSR